MPTLNLPPTHSPERDQAILARIVAGAFDPIVWGQVTSSIPGHTAIFLCSCDALSMDGVRINTTPQTAQQIADVLRCVMPTAKMVDLAFINRARVINGQELLTLLPAPQPETMTTQGWEEQSATIDGLIAKAGGAPPGGIIDALGKQWIVDNDTIDFHQTQACEYGWPFPGPRFGGAVWEPAVTPGASFRMIQGRGWFHSIAEQLDDYSMKFRAWSAQCFVDGQQRKTLEVLQDPVLCALGSAQGVLRQLRVQGVPPYKPPAPAGA